MNRRAFYLEAIIRSNARNVGIGCSLIVAVTIERKTQTEHVHREDDGGHCQCEIALHDRYLDLIATASQAAPQPAATIEPNSATIFAVVGREISAAKAEIIPAIIPSTEAMMFHDLPLTKYDLPRLGTLAFTSYSFLEVWPARRAPIVKAGHSQARGPVQCTHVKACSVPAARSRISSGISNVRMCRSISAK
jgi:hypothetical protein